MHSILHWNLRASSMWSPKPKRLIPEGWAFLNAVKDGNKEELGVVICDRTFHAHEGEKNLLIEGLKVHSGC